MQGTHNKLMCADVIQGWLEKEDHGDRAYGPDDEEDEEYIERAERFESEYNHRFEVQWPGTPWAEETGFCRLACRQSHIIPALPPAGTVRRLATLYIGIAQ